MRDRSGTTKCSSSPIRSRWRTLSVIEHGGRRHVADHVQLAHGAVVHDWRDGCEWQCGQKGDATHAQVALFVDGKDTQLLAIVQQRRLEIVK